MCKLRGVGTDPPDCLGKSVNYWNYFHNGAYARAGAGSTTVSDGDTQGWRYGTGGKPRAATNGTETSAAPPPTTAAPTPTTSPRPPATPTTRPSAGGGTPPSSGSGSGSNGSTPTAPGDRTAPGAERSPATVRLPRCEVRPPRLATPPMAPTPTAPTPTAMPLRRSAATGPATTPREPLRRPPTVRRRPPRATRTMANWPHRRSVAPRARRRLGAPRAWRRRLASRLLWPQSGWARSWSGAGGCRRPGAFAGASGLDRRPGTVVTSASVGRCICTESVESRQSHPNGPQGRPAWADPCVTSTPESRVRRATHRRGRGRCSTRRRR